MLEQLNREDLDINPLAQLRRWLSEAEAAGAAEATAMALATVGADGRPALRHVLLKQLDERGLGFFTDARSRKAHDLAAHPVAAVSFFWEQLYRQVTVEGDIEQLSRQEAKAYFSTRPYGSQVSSWSSRQGAVLSTREELEQSIRATEQAYSEGEVPTPPHWTGFLLRPTRVEFWQGSRFRRHDRFEYRLQEKKWDIRRLSP